MADPMIRALLYRAIRELAYIHEMDGCTPGFVNLITTSEGRQIIEQGMRVLEVADLSKESLYEEIA